MASAETKIEQNAEAIVLRATKAEVDTAKGQAISAASADAKSKADAALAGAKSYADAQIKVQADRITSSAAATDALGARVSTVEQTASGLSVSLESVEATANSANATAGAARTEAASAAKTASDYMQYTADGLEVGNKSSGSWRGFRSRMAAGAFEVIDAAGNVVARYGAKEIELGMGMLDAVIRMCGGKGAIAYYAGTDQLAVMAPGSIALAACQTLADGTVQPYDTGVACNRSGVLLKGAVEASGAVTKNSQPVLAEKVLYDNAAGTTGTVALAESAAGFDYVEIFFRTNDDAGGSFKAASPNGKKVALTTNFWADSPGCMMVKSRAVLVNGKTISSVSAGEVAVAFNNGSSYNSIYVTRVVGYR